MPIRCVIVDDEQPGRLNLRLALAAHPGWQIAAECASAASARAALAVHAVDVVFLDIQMPQESGLALARDLSRLREPPLIIFVTAHSVHAIEAFEVHALDYLLKPLDDARLAHAVERAAALLSQRQRGAYAQAVRAWLDPETQPWLEQVSVRSVGRIDQIRVDDIFWIEAAGNYVQLHAAGRRLLHRVALSRLEQVLKPGVFLRVHRGAIVRRDQMTSLVAAGDGGCLLTLRCGAEVAVSERYAPLVKASMRSA